MRRRMEASVREVGDPGGQCKWPVGIRPHWVHRTIHRIEEAESEQQCVFRLPNSNSFLWCIPDVLGGDCGDKLFTLVDEPLILRSWFYGNCKLETPNKVKNINLDTNSEFLCSLFWVYIPNLRCKTFVSYLAAHSYFYDITVFCMTKSCIKCKCK